MNSIKVLIADDEKDFVESISKVLGRRGFTVSKAFNGKMALETLKQEQFDVIVLDMRMPEMDGLAVLQEVRKFDIQTPVIILSGKADVGLAAKTLKGGAVEYLLKPCSSEALISALENANERKAIAKEVKEKKS